MLSGWISGDVMDEWVKGQMKRHIDRWITEHQYFLSTNGLEDVE